MDALTVSGWGRSSYGAELAGEEEDVAVAEVGGDGFEGEVGFGEEFFGDFDAFLEEVAMGGDADELLKTTSKMSDGEGGSVG